MSRSVREARIANSLVFFIHGLLVSTWVSRIPEVQTQLALNEAALGMALLGIAVGSLFSMPVAGVLISRHGSKTITVFSTYFFCAAVAGIPIAADGVTLSVLLLFYGAAAGAMDVAMNAQGVVIEDRYGRSVMSAFHALFSIGGMAGALIGGYIAQLGMTVRAHLALSALLCGLLITAVWRKLVGREHEEHIHAGPAFSLPRGPVIALGTLGFCLLLCEGAMADWVAIFLRDSFEAGPALAAAGYGIFSGAMAAGRLCGDSATERFGPVRIVQGGATVAAVALAFAILAPSVVFALAAFAVVGLGFAAIVPNVFAASGRIPGVPAATGIAAVTTMGYFGFLIGPPAIGWLAEWLTLRNALFVLVALSAVAALLGSAVRTAEARTTASFEPDLHG